MPRTLQTRVPTRCCRSPASTSSRPIALGFWSASAFAPFGGRHAFGHSGAGGSVGFADPEHHVAGGYVMNKMSMASPPTRSSALIRASYEAAGATIAPSGLASFRFGAASLPRYRAAGSGGALLGEASAVAWPVLARGARPGPYSFPSCRERVLLAASRPRSRRPQCAGSARTPRVSLPRLLRLCERLVAGRFVGGPISCPPPRAERGDADRRALVVA